MILARFGVLGLVCLGLILEFRGLAVCFWFVLVVEFGRSGFLFADFGAFWCKFEGFCWYMLVCVDCCFSVVCLELLFCFDDW